MAHTNHFEVFAGGIAGWTSFEIDSFGCAGYFDVRMNLSEVIKIYTVDNVQGDTVKVTILKWNCSVHLSQC